MALLNVSFMDCYNVIQPKEILTAFKNLTTTTVSIIDLKCNHNLYLQSINTVHNGFGYR
ncbi:Uncharacterised protein [Yersinia enterocolitica]|uniref:Uncharacterized protein n=1 Tax=Yersinia enterocolitica TaxID=630 RepID=A0ABP1Y2C1_YEREN|nr:Uncharacterised protein [Yersinia enterocolitica]CND38921.1 Uncharacterised protein [Yersinia enterocolitica]CNE60799.1 Uncharacterised protein [Yersinia enterocolitica]CNF48119.1 Uncharacterised protein [Yersinia enterocolitica]CRX80087.1 Uncharacterised protein [Yersinia enterocolitica]